MLEKMAILKPKPWVNPFGKISIFRILEYRKSSFTNQYCLKKGVGKMAIFGSKPWVNPFPKMSIFRLLELSVCIA